MNDIIEQYMEDLFVNPYEGIQRVCLGLHTFDRAFITADDEIGMPIGAAYEVFGASTTGKSTFCYSIMGMLGTILDTSIAIADLEGVDPKFLAQVLHFQGYKNIVDLITQGKDEEILQQLQDAVFIKDKRKKDTYGLGMLDSIGAISSYAEASSEFGEANMGRRAFLMAQLSRRLLPTMHPRKEDSQKVYFFTNHWVPKLAQPGYDTPGGEAKKYLCGVRLLLKRKEHFADGSYIIEGRVYKNRYGIRDKTFVVFMKSGRGIHRGLTTLCDCIRTNKAERAKGSNKITMNGESYGKFIDIIKKQWKDETFFQPFHDALEENEDE